jgi:hypothetical protein
LPYHITKRLTKNIANCLIKKGNFVKYRCLKKDVTFRQYTKAVGEAYDGSAFGYHDESTMVALSATTKQARIMVAQSATIIRRSTTEISAE